MATKIIHQPTEFKPVTIELKFTNRQQLAAFIEVIENSQAVAEALDGKCPLTKQAKLMDKVSTCEAIDGWISTIGLLDQLIELADA